MEKVMFLGREFTLTQEAHIDGLPGEEYYAANAEDAKGSKFEVTWNIKPEYLDEDGNIINNDDESELCDWDKPVDVRTIELNLKYGVGQKFRGSDGDIYTVAEINKDADEYHETFGEYYVVSYTEAGKNVTSTFTQELLDEMELI